MTYENYETSVQDSVPIELYDITYGTQSWHYTSANAKVTRDGNEYVPTAISRTAVASKASKPVNTVYLNLPTDDDVARIFSYSHPTTHVSILIRRYQKFDSAEEIITIFEGIVTLGEFKGHKAKLTAVPIESKLQKVMPRQTFQAMCNAALYDGRCMVDRNSHDHTGAILGIAGGSITVNGADTRPDGYFAGGEIVVGIRRLWVVTHTGNILEIFGQLPTDLVGESATVYAGCTHDATTCANKFNNLVNYRGFPYVPLKNVYATGLK